MFTVNCRYRQLVLPLSRLFAMDRFIRPQSNLSVFFRDCFQTNTSSYVFLTAKSVVPDITEQVTHKVTAFTIDSFQSVEWLVAGAYVF